MSVSNYKNYSGFGGANQFSGASGNGYFERPANNNNIMPISHDNERFTSTFANDQQGAAYNRPFAPPSMSASGFPPYGQSTMGSAGYSNSNNNNNNSKYQIEKDFEQYRNVSSNKDAAAASSSSSGPSGGLPQLAAHSMFPKRYAFENSTPGQYFNVDKYFQNFTDPLESIDIPAASAASGSLSGSQPPNNALTLNNRSQFPQQQRHQQHQQFGDNNYNNTLPYGSSSNDRNESPALQSRLVYENAANGNSNTNSVLPPVRGNQAPAYSFLVSEKTYIKHNEGIPSELFHQAKVQSSSPQQSRDNFAPASRPLPFQSAGSSAAPPAPSSYNFELSLPLYPEIKKSQMVSPKQSQLPQAPSSSLAPGPAHPQHVQQQNFFKQFHETNNRGGRHEDSQQHQQQQPVQISHSAFTKQLGKYLAQEEEAAAGRNILERYEQKNNKNVANQLQQYALLSNNNNNSAAAASQEQLQVNPYRSQAVAKFEKERTRNQSQAFLNRISTELEIEHVYFIKFLVEQITIDSELDKARTALIKSTEFSTQTLFNFFDRKRKGYIDLPSFLDGLEILSIPYIKMYVQKLFNRIVVPETKILRYCDFVELLAPTGKPALMTQLFSFVGPKNGVAKEQKKSYSIIQDQSANLTDDAVSKVHMIFSHLVSIEKSIQSFKELQGDEENLMRIFSSVDVQQKGYLHITDLVEYLNSRGGDYEKTELVGVFKRINFLTFSGRINFNEFLLSFQRDAVPEPVENMPDPRKQAKQKESDAEADIAAALAANNPNQSNQLNAKTGKPLKEPKIPGFQKIPFKGTQKKID